MKITRRQLRKMISEDIAISSNPAETANAAKIAKGEAEWWDGPKGDKQRRYKETDKEVQDRLDMYWDEAYTSLSGHKYPWSAAFLSYTLKDDPDFTGSKVHKDYIEGAAMNRYLWDDEKETSSVSKAASGKKPAKAYKGYVGFLPDEYTPDIGDLVCNSRDGGTFKFNPSKKTHSISDTNHCDICIDDNCKHIVGGNVGGDVCPPKTGCTSNVRPRGKYKMAITKNPIRIEDLVNEAIYNNSPRSLKELKIQSVMKDYFKE